MKTIILFLFLLVSSNCISQSSDIIYVPGQKNLVATYNFQNNFGVYMGGNLSSSFPIPYVYTTPISVLNRIGVVYGSNKVNLMGGVFVENLGYDSVRFKPDFWLKIYPLRIITNTNEGFDFIFALNYMNSFRYGFGVSIPFRGIYYR